MADLSVSAAPAVTASWPRSTWSGLLRAELTKLTIGRMWWGLASGAIAMSVLTAYGYASNGHDKGLAAAPVTSSVLRAWIMMFLFAALFTAAVHARDGVCGALARTVILSPGRRPVFIAKLLVTVIAGTGYGLIAAAGGAVTALTFPRLFDITPTWSRDASLTALGLFLCCILAAVFGLFLALIVRHVAGATGAVIAVLLLIDPAVEHLAPSAAKYLFSVALGAVYRDVGHELLSMWLGAVVAVAWVTALGVAAEYLLRRRDVTG